MSNTIHQEVMIAATPKRVFRALMDADEFSARVGGAPTSIEPNEGGAFSLFGGPIAGRHIELVPGRRIVQAWRVMSWPEGLYSIVRFELHAEGSGTRIVFDHVGFPENEKEHLDTGWYENYWNPLKVALEGAKWG